MLRDGLGDGKFISVVFGRSGQRLFFFRHYKAIQLLPHLSFLFCSRHYS